MDEKKNETENIEKGSVERKPVKKEGKVYGDPIVEMNGW